MVTARPNNLEYAPPLPLRKRKRFRRAALALVFVGAAVVLWRPVFSTWERLYVDYLAAQCGRHTAPATAVVCEEPPRWGGVTPPFVTAAPDPTPLARFETSTGQQVGGRGPVLFLHERITPQGQRAIVEVRRLPPDQRDSWDAPWAFQIFKHRRSGLGRWERGEGYRREVIPQVFRDDPKSVAVRFFAGQPDPSDRSRFTIKFEVDGERGCIDGQLLDQRPEEPDSGVQVELKTR